MKMKILNSIAGILALGGFLLLLGAAGESDLYDAMGQVLPVMVTVKKAFIGTGMLALSLFIWKKEEQ